MDNSIIKSIADTIYRRNIKMNEHLMNEKAAIDALTDIYKGQGADVLAIEMEKAGHLKRMANSIHDRIDIIHTNLLRMCEVLCITTPFKSFSIDDLDASVIEKSKSKASLDKAVKDLEKATMKSFTDALEAVFEKDMVKMLVDSIINTYKVANDRNHEPRDLGNIKRSNVSKFAE